MVSLRRTWGRVLLMLWRAFSSATSLTMSCCGSAGTWERSDLFLSSCLHHSPCWHASSRSWRCSSSRAITPPLSAIAPKAAQSAAERRTGWIEATLSSVVPFFAFYYAAGFYREDMASMLSVTEALGGVGSPDSALSLSLSVGVGIVFVVSFGLKQLWEKFKRSFRCGRV